MLEKIQNIIFILFLWNMILKKKIEKIFSKWDWDNYLNFTSQENEPGNYLIVIFPSYYDIIDYPKFRFIFQISSNKNLNVNMLVMTVKIEIF